MRFGKSQREQLQRTWNEKSWFYRNVGIPVRVVIEVAYGLTPSVASHQTKCQEDVSLALELFAGKIGASKSQVVHALLTGDFLSLMRVLIRDSGGGIPHSLGEKWVESFREVSMGLHNIEDGL